MKMIVKRGRALSATGILRIAWRELWDRTHAGGILLLAFWYSLITSLYQHLVASRIGPLLPQQMKTYNPFSGHPMAIPPLAPGLITKLVLVYLTLILVISPFAMAGLYSGTAAALGRGDVSPGFFAFFRYAAHHFWKTLGFIVLGILTALVLMLVAFVLLVTGSQLGVLSIVPMLVLMGIVFLWLGFIWYWLGSIFYGQLPVVQGMMEAFRWVGRHLFFTLRFVVLTVGLLIVVGVFLLLVMAVPIIGPVTALAVGGMILPAFIAAVSCIFYREGLRFVMTPPQ